MTREEAKGYIREWCPYDRQEEIIKALEQEHCEDCISREYILSKAHCCRDDLADDEPCCVDVDDIKEAPSVQPKPIECEDCISRVEVQKHIYRRLWESALNNVGYECKAEDVFMDIADNRLSTWISEIPSVQPIKPKGEWIEKDGFDGDTYYNCSECGESWTTIEGTPWINGMKYCPNCGAKMESEDKE